MLKSKLCSHCAVRTDEHMKHAVTVPEAAEAATPPTTLSTLLDQDWAPLYLANAVLLCSGDDVARGAHDVLSFAAACRAAASFAYCPRGIWLMVRSETIRASTRRSSGTRCRRGQAVCTSPQFS